MWWKAPAASSLELRARRMEAACLQRCTCINGALYLTGGLSSMDFEKPLYSYPAPLHVPYLLPPAPHFFLQSPARTPAFELQFQRGFSSPKTILVAWRRLNALIAFIWKHSKFCWFGVITSRRIDTRVAWLSSFVTCISETELISQYKAITMSGAGFNDPDKLAAARSLAAAFGVSKGGYKNKDPREKSHEARGKRDFDRVSVK